MKISIPATPVAISLAMAVKMATTFVPRPHPVPETVFVSFVSDFFANGKKEDTVSATREGKMIHFDGPRHCGCMQKIVVPVIRRLVSHHKVHPTFEGLHGMDFFHRVVKEAVLEKAYPNYEDVANFISGDSGTCVNHPYTMAENDARVSYAKAVNKWWDSLGGFILEETNESEPKAETANA